MLPLLIISPATAVAGGGSILQESARGNSQEAAQDVNVKRGLALLDEIIAEARALRLPENRALLVSSAADLLWTYDEQRARRLFMEALNNADEIIDGIDEDEPEYEQLKQSSTELRDELLRRVAARDLWWSRELIRATHHASQIGDEDFQLELTLAVQRASSDPQAAARIALESLEHGVHPQLPELVAELRERDRAAASKLADAIIIKLRSRDLANDEEAAAVALGLLRIGTESPAEDARDKDTLPSPLLNQQSAQALAEMIVAAALSPSANGTELLSMLQPLLHTIERYPPARARLLKRKLATVTVATDTTVSPMEGERAGASQERIIGAAPEATDASNEMTATKNPSDARQNLWRIVTAGKVDETLSALAIVRAPEERMLVLSQLAGLLIAENERERALQLLTEAESLTPRRARNAAQLRAQLQLASAFVALDTGRSFKLLDNMIYQLNELAAATIVADNFISEEPLGREDELILKLLARFKEILSDDNANGQALASLTRLEFDRMKQTADKLELPELRALAHLFLAESLLSRKPAASLKSR